MAFFADAPNVIWETMIWGAIILGSTAGVLVLVGIVGCFYPRSYTASRTLETAHSPEEVWSVISDFANTPNWHGEVKKVERLPDRDGHELWRETDRRGYAMQLETIDAAAPRRLVRKISDENGPFSGQWQFDIEPAEKGCRVTLTEQGQIPNPFFRLMFWLFMTPTFYLDLYLQALAKKLGDKPKLL
jgi:uncharacterized protein YndB with AHSA1/START domain